MHRKIKLQYAISILHYSVTDIMAPLYHAVLTPRLASTEVDWLSSYIDQTSIRVVQHAHLQQPAVDAGVLSRLRSMLCERGIVDAPGSFFGNFFARYKCAMH